MTIVHVHSLHLHSDWMAAVVRWSKTVDVITIAGDSLPLASCVERDHNEVTVRRWLSDIECPVFYSRGPYDPNDMDDWGLDHLHTSGTIEINGYAIHVIDSYSDGPKLPHESHLPGVIVSHHAPACALVSVDAVSCECHGRLDVRAIATELGDVRLMLCGGLWQPRRRTDWAEGAMCVCPGMSRSGQTIEPAYARVDLGRREIKLHNRGTVEVVTFARP